MLNRRKFLQLSAAGATVSGLASAFAAPAMPLVPPMPPMPMGPRKMLFLFMRGGNDGVNAVIPSHDADYNSTNRPTIFVPANMRLDLGNGGAAFHPKLAKLKEVFDTGELAVLHRLGYDQSTLSHFSGQQFWETAVPGDESFTEGFGSRWVRAFDPTNPLAAASISEKPQLIVNATNSVIPHVPDLAQYNLGNDPSTTKLMGSLPGPNNPGSGLLRLFQSSGAATFDSLVRETGIVMADTLANFGGMQAVPPQPSLYPQTDPDLAAEGLPQGAWVRRFFRNLSDAVNLLKQTSCRIVAIELDQFDHHAAQGGVTGQHGDLLHMIGHGFRSVRWDTLGDIWPDLAVVAVSEFGRTSQENGSLGTDHGKAGAAFVAGGGVIGGVHNCDPVTWPSGNTMFSDNNKYVAHRTDFRAVLAEIFERHLGTPPGQLDLVIPGWSSLSGNQFNRLGFLA